MMAGLTNAVRGITGEFEINRLVGAFGAVAYVVGAHAFVGYELFWKGRDFDLTAYCLAFPSGLGVAVGAIAGAVAWKDKAVASAKVTEQTGTVPAPPPAGPQTPLGKPPPVDEVTRPDDPDA